jgi:hypothetical protein
VLRQFATMPILPTAQERPRVGPGAFFLPRVVHAEQLSGGAPGPKIRFGVAGATAQSPEYVDVAPGGSGGIVVVLRKTV